METFKIILIIIIAGLYFWFGFQVGQNQAQKKVIKKLRELLDK